MMEIKVTQEALIRIWNQLNAAHRPGRLDGRRTAHLDVLKEGWGMSCDIQDILWETDDRADMLTRHNDDFSCLLAPYSLHFTSRFRGPFSNVNQVLGHRAMQASDVAMYVMEIERIGFTVDAEALVAGIRPTLLRRKYITNSELSVLWYSKQRHRCEPFVLRVPDGKPTSSSMTITNSGYKVTALLEEDRPVTLRIDASKSSKRLALKYWIPGELHRTIVA